MIASTDSKKVFFFYFTFIMTPYYYTVLTSRQFHNKALFLHYFRNSISKYVDLPHISKVHVVKYNLEKCEEPNEINTKFSECYTDRI